jgi:hypothetical protein
MALTGGQYPPTVMIKSWTRACRPLTPTGGWPVSVDGWVFTVPSLSYAGPARDGVP